ncbi:MAG: hypothetical protein PUH10_06730 [Erysipelotrichaceae bacterium]|uniref:hypothetical protein n=1 Tax=Floccifex sp. TaxID=2815810 RepID=UPI002A753922|nr:hypothetical protein [Floccifex sp.]MDD7281668.1 hypothetical protein [Erysipelotrichaceae bacterium]MDY2957915.1 hypothetical protein [Floccifex sp.]
MKNINPEFKKKMMLIGLSWMAWIGVNIIGDIILETKTWTKPSASICATIVILLPDFIRTLRKKIDKRKGNSITNEDISE